MDGMKLKGMASFKRNEKIICRYYLPYALS